MNLLDARRMSAEPETVVYSINSGYAVTFIPGVVSNPNSKVDHAKPYERQ